MISNFYRLPGSLSIISTQIRAPILNFKQQRAPAAWQMTVQPSPMRNAPGVYLTFKQRIRRQA